MNWQHNNVNEYCANGGVAWFERPAHFPFYEEPERFHEEMLRIDGQVRLFQASPRPR